jgi:hypothetical protein
MWLYNIIFFFSYNVRKQIQAILKKKNIFLFEIFVFKWLRTF